MMRALFTATSGMIIQEKRQMNVSNNLANAGTTGYKFKDMIAKETNESTIQNREKLSTGQGYMRKVGELSLGAEIDELYIDYEQGALEDTNKPLDFALQGEGFFKIRYNNNQYGYTRNGHFTIDSKGYLCTQDGKRVLSDRGKDIRIENKAIEVNEQGEIYLDGEEEYKFGIVSLQSVKKLDVIGEGVYLIKDGREKKIEDTAIYQNKLERSNVNPLEEMVKMIQISRTFESNQKVIQAVDEILGKSVNEVGRVR